MNPFDNFIETLNNPAQPLPKHNVEDVASDEKQYVWQSIRHYYKPGGIRRIVEQPIEYWLPEVLNKLHATHLYVIEHTSEVIVVLIKYPIKYQQSVNYNPSPAKKKGLLRKLFG